MKPIAMPFSLYDDFERYLIETEIVDAIISKMEKGERVVVTNDAHNNLIDRLDALDHALFGQLTFEPNPNQVETPGRWIAFFKL